MSYLEHFKLKEQPFRLTPDPDFLYWSKQHARAKAYMESTIWLADGFVVLGEEITRRAGRLRPGKSLNR